MNPSLLRFNTPRARQGVLLALLTPVLAVNIWCGGQILRLVSFQTEIKEDYAQVNSIRNGLLSVEVWKNHIHQITAQRIDKIKLTREQEDTIRDIVASALGVLITEADKTLKRPQKTLGGKVRKLAYNVFVDANAVKKDTPRYAQAILDEMKKTKNIAKLKTLALSQIQDAKKALDESDDTLQKLLTKYGAKNTDAFNRHVKGLIDSAEDEVGVYTMIMLGSLVLFLGAWVLVRRSPEFYKPLFALSVGLAFILLMSGLALPMIDIDARIRNIDFLLLGEHLQFSNQLLFYRSKSIMQMVSILISAGKTQTVFVGFLIFLFSIIFPIAKLASALVCLFTSGKIRENKVVRFFAYQSGKWSMADVMVVAIFMAYIGFNGVLNNQIQGLNFRSETIGVIATNETSLQPGFTLFLAFVLFGLLLSVILKKIVPEDREVGSTVKSEAHVIHLPQGSIFVEPTSQRPLAHHRHR